MLNVYLPRLYLSPINMKCIQLSQMISISFPVWFPKSIIIFLNLTELYFIAGPTASRYERLWSRRIVKRVTGRYFYNVNPNYPILCCPSACCRLSSPQVASLGVWLALPRWPSSFFLCVLELLLLGQF